MYVYDCNTILTAPIKDRNDKEMIYVLTDLARYLKARGFKPFHYVVDK